MSSSDYASETGIMNIETGYVRFMKTVSIS